MNTGTEIMIKTLEKEIECLQEARKGLTAKVNAAKKALDKNIEAQEAKRREIVRLLKGA